MTFRIRCSSCLFENGGGERGSLGTPVCIRQTDKKTRLSQNKNLRWPLLFHIRLKSFGFSSKKGVYKFPLAKFIVSNRFSPVKGLLRGYFCKIMCYGQQAKFNFHLLQSTEMEPLETLVVLEISKYGFHILRSLASVFKSFCR